MSKIIKQLAIKHNDPRMYRIPDDAAWPHSDRWGTAIDEERKEWAKKGPGQNGTAIIRGKKSVETMSQGDWGREKKRIKGWNREIQHRCLGEGIYMHSRCNKCFTQFCVRISRNRSRDKYPVVACQVKRPFSRASYIYSNNNDWDRKFYLSSTFFFSN